MKSIMRFLLASTLMLFISGQIFAQADTKSGSDKAATATTVQGTTVDHGNNGKCDNHEGKGRCTDCKSFVDKDGNGVCDNCGASCKSDMKAGCQGQKDGQGCGQGQQKCGSKESCQGKDKGACCPAKSGSCGSTSEGTAEPKK
jgi:hypothetical protein